jgi:hypothetical protein
MKLHKETPLKTKKKCLSPTDDGEKGEDEEEEDEWQADSGDARETSDEEP